MEKPIIAPQREFKSLEDFIKDSNNFYAHFLNDCLWGGIYRKTQVFQRFQTQNPDLEKETTLATVQAVRATPRQRKPYELLFQAYQKMSLLVFITDKDAMHDGKPDERYLTR